MARYLNELSEKNGKTAAAAAHYRRHVEYDGVT